MIRVIIVTLAFKAILCEETTTPLAPADADSTTLAVDSEDENTASGILTEPRQRRGYNGVQVAIEQYPYVVSLHDQKGYFSCSGSILTARLILTAHHCVTPPRIPYTIKVGSRDILSGGTIYPIKNIIYYRGADVTHHDIAMLYLTHGIKNGYRVTLSNARYPFAAGVKLQALGWGQTARGPIRYLEKVDIWSVDYRDCERYYGPKGSWICTHTHKSATCHGDSGGPLMYNGYQVGITSHSQAGHCKSDFPTANVYVSSYLPWINAKMRQYV